MIITLQGDITLIEKGIIGHQVNCLGVMASGVAKSIADKYPIAKQEYIKKHMQSGWHLGDSQFVKINDNLYVANLAGQETAGRNKNITYTSIDGLTKALIKLNDFAHVQDLPIFLPKLIGCGFGNEKWENVLPVIEKSLDNVFLIDYIPGVIPDPLIYKLG